ncbi:Formamidopyrimidine-DNA glycosylase [Alkalibacterium sp. AK22]|uniref:bifunctional DNA-formamidopyrimidine glycosylase/DNA-(apurinic or apyrimidinic site) lyase n=1 Tax=Alkalibacterium sp. AK22 TaxID=1229520 RepID=UPI00044AC43F|nr:bifunctional DNA-formamidopyrimidine glycosylase/DNA-(apurinic or apyrimidinic site) lyase [Alkalibacterium sp. AK22]EXJ22903.1 Formamidopyrimidine-DNA glycosylase [Alkalibacterium sp. AK22]
MPELPEVENVKNGLLDLLPGKVIKEVQVLWPNIIKDPAANIFSRQLAGQTIENIGRRGKFLLFYLSDYVLISHLRMEGKFRVETTDTPLARHTHVVFKLNGEEELRYLDVRKFGKMSLTSRVRPFEHPSLVSLGPEPTADKLNDKWVSQFLQNRKRAIKACLLDQTLVAGIGNIYADEILFDARIHPSRPAYSLKQEDISRLTKSIITIMDKAVKSGGTTIRTYANAYGDSGTYQHNLKVYGRDQAACTRCGTRIEKIKVAQRGTHFCPLCQPAE